MSNLTPYVRLDIATYKIVYGLVLSSPQAITWNLAGLFGRPDTAFSGLVPDPTGQYLIQQPVYVPIPADPSRWTVDGAAPLPTVDTGDPTAPVHAAGTDEGKGVTSLRQTRGGPSVLSKVIFASAHADDEGMALGLMRGGPVTTPGAAIPGKADFNLYIELNWGREAGTTGLRLAMEAGNPIRLETSDDDVTWTTADVAAALGDSEAYLTSKGRNLLIEVCPLTSSAYYDALAAGQTPASYGKPADLVAVTLNGGDAVLVYQEEAAEFPAGKVRLTGKGGQWNALYALRRYLPGGLAGLPEQQRLKPLTTSPQGRVRGFLPYGAAQVVVTPTLTSRTAATAQLTVQTPPGALDGQAAVIARVPGGAAILTAILSAATLDFPGVFQGPTAVPDTISYTTAADGLIGLRERQRFAQDWFGITRSATVFFSDPKKLLAPGRGVTAAIQAAAVTRGFTTPEGYDDRRVGFAGISGLGKPGFRWYWQDGKPYFALEVSDGWRENVPILWMESWDAQCLYCIARELGYKMGLTDDAMAFPYCVRDSDCPHYRLPSGTLKEPLFKVPPTMLAGQALRFLRASSGERDPISGQVQPMYLFFDRQRVLQFFPMPIGLVNIFVDPAYDPVLAGLAQSKVFSAVPAFSGPGLPALNEFVRGTLESAVSLDNIRTDVVLAGQRPGDGAFLAGFESSPNLGPEGSGRDWGNVGIQVPFVDINRLYANPEALEIALANAHVQTSFPATTTDFSAFFQSDLEALDTVGVIDPWSQGSDVAIPYYVTGLDSDYMLRETGWDQGSLVGGHLLGQAGD